MELVLLVLLLVLIGLVIYLLISISKPQDHKDRIESVLNEKFIDFSKNIRETMDNTRKEVESSKDVLSKNTIETLKHINSMSSTIGTLISQQEKVQQLGQSLEYLLQSPKLRGNYGEAILEEMLDKILPKGIWEKQYTIEGGEKVDAVVKYKNVVVPIDSKFPKEDYQKYLKAEDVDEKKASWAAYEKALKIQINSIKDKYIKPEKGTSEFALLFIPSEAIYYETIAENNHLGDPCQIYEYATSRKVIPVSPNTFYAFLNVIMLGIRNIEIAKEAKKLQELLSRLERDYGYFFKNFEDIGRALDKAAKCYNTGKGQVERFKKNLDSALMFEIDEAKGSDPELLAENK